MQIAQTLTSPSLSSPPTPTWYRRSPGSVLSLGVFAIVLVLVLATAMRSPLKDDVAWLLYVARRWLSGQRLYQDVIEVNPPLIIWLYALPAAIANWLDVAPKLIAVPVFSVMILGSAWWSASLLHGRGPLFAERAPVFSVIAIVMLVLPGVEFGQREHLMTASLLPFLCLMARWLDGERTPRPTSLAAGLLAGLGCALKPTYALAFLVPEVIGWMRGRKLLRTAPMAATVAGLAYVGLVALVCPAFFTRAIPLALALYGGTDMPPLALLWNARVLVFGLLAGVTLWIVSAQALRARTSFTGNLYLVLVAFAAGATIVYVLQGKDWFYHQLPATTALVLALVLWAAEILPRTIWPWRRLVPAAALAGCAFLAFAHANLDRMRPWVQDAVEPELSTETRLVKILKHENAKTYIAFSEWIGLGFPVVNDTGVVWASRFDSMWALKGELWRARQDGRAPKEWPIRRWIAQDFIAGCPDIAVVDTREDVNWIGVLVAGDPRFARVWQRYTEIARFNGLRVLKRRGANCGRPVPATVAIAP